MELTTEDIDIITRIRDDYTAAAKEINDNGMGFEAARMFLEKNCMHCGVCNYVYCKINKKIHIAHWVLPYTDDDGGWASYPDETATLNDLLASLQLRIDILNKLLTETIDNK